MTHHDGSVWRHGHVEDPLGVAEQLRDLGHGRVLPDGDLVPGEPVRRDQLPVLGRPQKRAHLGIEEKFGTEIRTG